MAPRQRPIQQQSDPQIEQEQRELKRLGFYSGEIDGIDGPATQEARKAYQAQNAQNRGQELDAQRAQAEAAKAQAEARAAEMRARERQLGNERETEARSPERQALEVAKYGVPVLSGMYLGHRTAEGTERRIASMSPDMQRNMNVGRRFSPYLARSATRFLPEAGLALYGANQLRESNPVLSEVLRAGGAGLASAGLVNAGEGLAKSLTAPDVPLPASTSAADLANVPTIQVSAPDTPQSSSAAPEAPRALPAPTPAKRQHADRLTSAAKAARDAGVDVPEGVDISKKSGASQFLSDLDMASLDKAARTAIAKEVGVKPGANFADRISTAISSMAKRPGSSAVAGPLMAAGLAYELTPNRAEAGTGAPSGNRDEALTNAAVAGGGYLTARELAKRIPIPEAISRTAGAVGRVAGRALGPELGLASPEAMNAGEAVTGALGIPSFQQRMADRSGISQVPDRGERGLLGRRDLNAAALNIPANAYSSIPEQGQVNTAFESAMSELQSLFSGQSQSGAGAP